MKVIFKRGIFIQADATEYNLFKSLNCSNMFRVVFCPSSAVHNTVSTVSGINETVTAKCRERGWAGYLPRSQQVAVTVSLMPDTVDTVL